MTFLDAIGEPSIQEGQAHIKLVTLTVGGQTIGVPIDKVRDVFFASSITSVPLAPAMIAGLVNLRGKVVTVLSMRSIMGFPAKAGSEMTVGIEWRGEAFGLLVDEVGEVIDVVETALERNPPNLDPRWAGISAGIRRLDDRLLIQLDADRLFDFPAAA